MTTTVSAVRQGLYNVRSNLAGERRIGQISNVDMSGRWMFTTLDGRICADVTEVLHDRDLGDLCFEIEGTR